MKANLTTSSRHGAGSVCRAILLVTYAFLLFASVLPGDLLAQSGNGLATPPVVRPYPTVNRSTRATISTTTTTPQKIEDNGYATVNPFGTFTGTDDYLTVRWWQVHVYFHAGGDRETYEQGSDTWEASVKGDIVVYRASDPNTPVTLASDIELKLNQSAPEELYTSEFLAPDLHPMHSTPSADRYVRVDFHLKDAVEGFVPSGVAGVDDVLRLTLSLEEELVHEFPASVTDNDRLHCDVAASTLILDPGTLCGSPQPDMRSVQVNTTVVTLKWTAPPDHPDAKYDLIQIELLRLHNTDRSIALDDHHIKAVVDWTASVKYEVAGSATSLAVVPARGTGFYLFRVRPVTSRFDGRTADLRNYGPWSPAPAQGALVELSACENAYSIQGAAPGQPPHRNVASFWYQEPDGQRPFTHTQAVLSDTTRTSLISDRRVYVSALGQVVQTQALNRADNVVLGSAAVADMEGRPSLVTMHAPFRTSDGTSWKSALGYQANAVKTVGNSLYTAESYDDPSSSLSNPAAVSMTSPLAWYNSDNNPDLSIPSSQGYPYIRAVYKADGTVMATVPPGLDMRPPGSLTTPQTERQEGRSSRYYQGSVTSAEMTSIFGDEAPLAQRVTKTISISPDGVTSASYYDGGQLIASCLVDAGELAGNTSINAAGQPVITADGSGSLLNLNGIGDVNSPTREVINSLDNVSLEFAGGARVEPSSVVGSMKLALASATQCTVQVTRRDEPGVEIGGCYTECIECEKQVRVRISRIDVVPVAVVDERTVEASTAKVCSTAADNVVSYVVTLGPGEYVIERVSALDQPDANGRRRIDVIVEDVVDGKDVEAALGKLLAECFDPTFSAGPECILPPVLPIPDHYKAFRIGQRGCPPPEGGVRTVSLGQDGPCITVPLPELQECYRCFSAEELADVNFDPDDLGFEEYALQEYKKKFWDPAEFYLDFFYYWDEAGLVKVKKFGNLDTTADVFDRIVLGMLRNSVECGYNCRDLWRTWKSLVATRLNEMHKDPNARSRALPDIVEEFLAMSGYCWAATDVPDNNYTIENTNEADLAFRHLRALNQARLTDCMGKFLTTDPDYWTKVASCAHSLVSEGDKKEVSDQVDWPIPKNGNEAAFNNAIMFIKLALEAWTRCESLRSEFELSIREAASPNTPTDAEVYCKVQAAVDECKTACRYVEPETYESWALRLRKRLFGMHSIKEPGEGPQCENGYTLANNTRKLIDLLVDYLNDEYRILQQTATIERCVNFAPRAYSFLAQYMPHLTIPQCIRNEGLVGDNPATLQTEDSPEPDCDAAEDQAGMFRRWTFRVIPKVDGTFYRPKRDEECELCAVSFRGPRARTDIHAWVNLMNAMVDSLWGLQLVDQHAEDGSTSHLVGDDSLHTYGVELKPLLLSPTGTTNLDLAYANELNDRLFQLYAWSPGVNGAVNAFWPFIHVEKQIIPGKKYNKGVGILSAFDRINYSFRDTVDTGQLEWRTFGNMLFDFGAIADSGFAPSATYSFGWWIDPVIADSALLTGLTMTSVIAGESRQETFECSVEGEEIRQHINNAFTSTIGHFEQDARRRLVFVDEPSQRKYPIETLIFHETHNREVMEWNTTGCSAELICPITPSCPICIKYDTIATTDYDDVDQIVAPPCEDLEIERLKAEITHLFMEEVRKLRESIAAQYAEKCLNTASVTDGVKATYDLNNYHYTLYYYDRAGKLIRTVSPKGVKIDANRTISTTVEHDFVSRFKTDSKGRMLVKTAPDGGSEYYEYDEYGRLRFIYDAVQSAATQTRMIYIKYDDLGRIKETGEVDDLGNEQSRANCILERRNERDWPTSADKTRNDVVVYVYDHAANTTEGGSGESGWTPVVEDRSGLVQRNLRLRLSWAYRVPEWPKDWTLANLSNVVRTFFSYDAQGNVTTVVHDIPYSDAATPNGTDRLVKRVDYRHDHSTGAPLAVDYQVHGVDDDADRFQHRYEYDINLRLKAVETSRTGVMWDRDIVNTYNFDGTLRRETIGEDSVQGIDYTYTLSGLLKGINHPSLDRNSDPGGDGADVGSHMRVGRDVFGMSAHYHANDFMREYNSLSSPFNDEHESMLGVHEPSIGAPRNLFGGMIGAVSYRTQEFENSNLLRDGMLMGEQYQYDVIGRFRVGVTFVFESSNWVSDGNGGWSSGYNYDPNTNVVSVKRWAMTSSSSSTLYDNAVLAATSSSSDLLSDVSDNGSPIAGVDGELNTSTNMQADENGRVSNSELGSVVSTNAYRSDHLINEVVRGATGVRIHRDPFGQTVRNDVLQNGTLEKTFLYIPGSVGADEAAYVVDDDTPALFEWSISGRALSGVCRDREEQPLDHQKHRNVGKKIYTISDNSGSVRALISDVKDYSNQVYTPRLIAVDNYEVYGSSRPNLNSTDLTAAEEFVIGFQGMQRIRGLGSRHDYLTPFRLYDTRLGSWSSQDLVHHPWSSPYSGLGGNPVLFRDPMGLAPGDEGAKNSAPEVPSVPTASEVNDINYVTNRRAIDMSGFSAKSYTAAGDIRNHVEFWNAYLKKAPEHLSEKNKALIKQNSSPIVDDVWIKHNPADKQYAKQKLHHHHIQGTNLAVAVPESRHLGTGVRGPLHATTQKFARFIVNKLNRTGRILNRAVAILGVVDLLRGVIEPDNPQAMQNQHGLLSAWGKNPNQIYEVPSENIVNYDGPIYFSYDKEGKVTFFLDYNRTGWNQFQGVNPVLVPYLGSTNVYFVRETRTFAVGI